MFGNKRSIATAKMVHDLRDRVFELESLIYKPRLEALIEEYKQLVPYYINVHQYFISGKQIWQYQGCEHKTWTEEEFRTQKLDSAKAKAYDEHKCPNIPGMNPQEMAITSTITAPTPKRKRRR